MPDFNAPALATLAQNLIDRFGGLCELHTFALPAVNTVTPWKPQLGDVAETVTTARMVVLPKTRENQSPARYADGTERRVGDLNVYIGPTIAIAPDVGSMIVRKSDNSRWSIKSCTPLDPNGIVLLYELWIQK